MAIETFYCPHCNAKLSQLEKICPFCKQTIVLDIAYKLAWLDLIQRDIATMYQEQMWPKDELHRAVQNLCHNQSQLLRTEMTKRLRTSAIQGQALQPAVSVEGQVAPQPVAQQPVEGQTAPQPVAQQPVEGQTAPQPIVQQLVEGQTAPQPIVQQLVQAPTTPAKALLAKAKAKVIQSVAPRARPSATPRVQPSAPPRIQSSVTPRIQPDKRKATAYPQEGQPRESQAAQAFFVPLGIMAFFLFFIAFFHQSVMVTFLCMFAFAWSIWQSKLRDDEFNNTSYRILQFYNIACTMAALITIVDRSVWYWYQNFPALPIIWVFLLINACAAHFARLGCWTYSISFCLAIIGPGLCQRDGLEFFMPVISITTICLAIFIMFRGMIRFIIKLFTPVQPSSQVSEEEFAAMQQELPPVSSIAPVAPVGSIESTGVAVPPVPTTLPGEAAPVTSQAAPVAPTTSMEVAGVSAAMAAAPAPSEAAPLASAAPSPVVGETAPVAPAIADTPAAIPSATSVVPVSPIVSVQPSSAPATVTPSIRASAAPSLPRKRIFPKVLQRTPKQSQPPKPQPAQPSVSAKEVIMSYITHPAVRENILLFLGIFLIMTGEVFVVVNTWDTMSETLQQMGILALLLSSSVFFYFLARITLRFKQSAATSIFYFLAIFLLPLAMLLPTSMMISKDRVWGIGTALLILGMAVWYGRTLVKLLPELRIVVHYVFPVLLLLNLLAPLADQAFPWMWAILGYSSVIIAILSWKNFADKTALYLWMAISVCAALTMLGHLQSWLIQSEYPVSTTPLSFYLPYFAYSLIPGLISLRLARLDCKQHEQTSLSFLMIMAITLSIAGLCLGFNQRLTLLGTAALLMLVFSYYAHWQKSVPLFFGALLASVIVYFLLPAPFKDAVLQFKAWVSGELGYSAAKPLPFSYYGITFFPYLACLCYLGTRLVKAQQPRLLRALQTWFLFLSVGLLGLVKFAGSSWQAGFVGAPDLRPLLVTLPLFGIGYFFAVRCLRLPMLTYFSIGAVSLWFYDGIPTIYLALQGVSSTDFWNANSASHTAILWIQPIILAGLAFIWGVWACFMRSENRAYLCDSALALVVATTAWLGYHQFRVPAASLPSGIYIGCLEYATAALWLLMVVLFRTRLLWLGYMLASGFAVHHIANWYAPQDLQILSSFHLIHGFALAGLSLFLLQIPTLGRYLNTVCRPTITSTLSFRDWAAYPLAILSLMAMAYGYIWLGISDFWILPTTTSFTFLAVSAMVLVMLAIYLPASWINLTTPIPWAMAVIAAMYCQQPEPCWILSAIAIIFMAWTWRMRIVNIQLWIPAVISICLGYGGVHSHWQEDTIGFMLAGISLVWIILRQLLVKLGLEKTDVIQTPQPSNTSTSNTTNPTSPLAKPVASVTPTVSNMPATTALTLEIYSLILAFLSFIFLMQFGDLHKLPSVNSVYGLIVLPVVFVVHTLKRPWRIFNLLAVIVATLAVVQTASLWYPPSARDFKPTFTAITVSLVLWGAALYLLHRTLDGQRNMLPTSWQKNPALVGDIRWFADAMFFFVYIVATYTTVVQQNIDFLPIAGLLICSFYTFAAGVDKQQRLPIYIAAIILNQTLITIYLFATGAPLIYRIPLVQALVCLVFRMTSWIVEYNKRLRLAAQVLDRYSAATLFAVLFTIGVWRLDWMLFGNWQFLPADTHTTYMLACFLMAALFLIIRKTTQISFMSYPGLLALLLGVIISLDHSPNLDLMWYMTATASTALVYAGCGLVLPSMTRELNHVSIALGSLHCIMLPIWYFTGQTPLLFSLLSFVLLALTLLHYLQSKQNFWLGLAILDWVLAIGYTQVIVSYLPIPEYGRLAGLAVWMALSLGIVYILRNVVLQRSFPCATLSLVGKDCWESSSTMFAFLIQSVMVIVLVLWLVWSRFFAALGIYIFNYTVPFIQQLTSHEYILLITLLAYLAIQVWMARTTTHIVGNWQEHGLWCNLILIAFWFTPISRFCNNQPNGFVFGGVECALVAVLASALQIRRQRPTWLLWSIAVSILVTLVAFTQYDLLSSVVALFGVSLTFLFLSHGEGRKNLWQPLYWTIFPATLCVLISYWVQQIEAPENSELVCLVFLAIAGLLSVLKEKLCQDMARFALWIGFVLLAVQTYISTPPIPSPANWAIPCLFVLSAGIFYRLGNTEEKPLSHYSMLFVLPILYWFFRSQLQWWQNLTGYDTAVCFVLFAFGPHLVALCFSPLSRWPRILSDFGLLLGATLICLENSIQWQLIPTTLGISFMAFLLLVRQWLLQTPATGTVKTEVPRGDIFDLSRAGMRDLEETLETTASVILMFFAIIAGIYGYFFHSQGMNLWLPCLALILSVSHFFAYLMRQTSWNLWFGYSLGILAGYTAVALNFELKLFAHIGYLVAITNFLLLAHWGKKSIYQLGRGLAWNREQAKEVATNLSWGIVTAILCLGVMSLFVMKDPLVVKAVGSHPGLFWLASFCTIATIYHTNKYYAIPYHGIVFFTVCLGLSSPISHWLTGADWLQFSPPCVEAALVACIAWAINVYYPKLTPWFGHFLLAAAIYLLPWDRHSPLMFVTLFATSLYFLLLAIQKQLIGFFRVYAGNMLLAIYFLIFYLLPSRGNPPPLVFPLLAIVTALLGFSWIVAQRLFSGDRFPRLRLLLPEFTHIAGFFSIIATVLILAGVVMISDAASLHKFIYLAQPHAYDRHTILSGTAFVFTILLTLLLDRKTGKLLYVLQFQGLLIGFYYFIRLRAHWFDFLEGYDAHALVIFSLTFYEIGQYLEKVGSQTKARAYTLMGYLLPSVGILYQPWGMQLAGSGLVAIAAVHYGIIYLDTLRKWVLMLCLALLNLAIFQFWASQAMVDPQFYGIPLGLTLILLGELHRDTAKLQVVYTLRLIGLLMVYGSSATQVLLKLDNPIYSLALGILALVGIVIGVVKKNNLYLYFASTFLVCDVLGYILNYGAKHGILGGILLVMAGVVIVSAALWFKFKPKKDADVPDQNQPPSQPKQ